ncbi:hypothetical protein VKT23_004872 [Stygiomarasmius scandens]|uniref:Uncharacterized protein n=1 Tax=Marasmiellus scandens TaxID=2682957 RepID=A0ABR1JUC4_9AGAR
MPSKHPTAASEAPRRSTRQLIARFCTQFFSDSKKRAFTSELESDGRIDVGVDLSLVSLACQRHDEQELDELKNQDPAILEYIMNVGIEAYCSELAQSCMLAPTNTPGLLLKPPLNQSVCTPDLQPPPNLTTQPQLRPNAAQPSRAVKRQKNSRRTPSTQKQEKGRKPQNPRNQDSSALNLAIPNLRYTPCTAPSAAPSSAKVEGNSHLNNLSGIERRRARQQMRRATRQNALAQTGVTSMHPTPASDDSAEHCSSQRSGFSILGTRLSKPGWKGLDLRAETRKLLNSTWSNLDSNAELRKALLGCQLVPYEDGLATAILDSDGLIAVYRSRIVTRNRLDMATVMKTAENFVGAVQRPFRSTDMQSNARGSHWYSILGYDRNHRKARASCTYLKLELTPTIAAGPQHLP